MSLDYTLTKIKDYETVCWEVDEHPENAGFEGMFSRSRYDKDDGTHMVMKYETHLLVFATMEVGIGQLTEASLQEFWVRLSIMERMFGAHLRQKDPVTGEWTPKYYTYDEVKQHIGLSTNVSYVSPTKWNTQIMKRLREDTLKSVPR